MTSLSDDATVRLLRDALAPPRAAAPPADLWPRVRGRIDRGLPPPTAVDWVLIAAAAALCLLQPSAILVPLFHF